MDVKLLSMTESPLRTIWMACRQCTTDGPVSVLEEPRSASQMESLVRKVVGMGHTSVLEHVSLTFAVEGVSRVLSHQLVRHRIASYSQQSQRYAGLESGVWNVIPPSIGNDFEASHVYAKVMGGILRGYEKLVELGVPMEDARFVLPNACRTNLVVTMNCRALLHFLEERCCSKAQWEIRLLAWRMYAVAKGILPCVFDHSGPKCERLGYCPEAKGCGRKAGRVVPKND